MAVQLSRRAGIALRSLSKLDNARVQSAINNKLENFDGQPAININKSILAGKPGENWYSLKINQNLRVLFKFEDGKVSVEDISTTDKMRRVLGHRL